MLPRVITIIVLVLSVIFAGINQASAYHGETGCRAPDIGGWDIVHHRNVHLSDYAGMWVLVEFSAMWCGPCQRELPGMLDTIRPYLDSGRLQVVMVSCDTPETLPQLKAMLRKRGISFPVLYDGGGFSTIPMLDWCHNDTLDFGIPSIVLVNPQGVVVVDRIAAENLAAVLDFFLTQDRPVIGIRSWQRENGDGSYTFTVDVVNPLRTPLEVRMSYIWEEWLCDSEDPERLITDIEYHFENNYRKAVLQFDEFAEAQYEVTVVPAAQHDIFGYAFLITYPGSQHYGNLGENGICLRTGNGQAYVVGVEHDGEKWHKLDDEP